MVPSPGLSDAYVEEEGRNKKHAKPIEAKVSLGRALTLLTRLHTPVRKENTLRRSMRGGGRDSSIDLT